MAGHDYSTSVAGAVPLGQRRPRSHFASLWITFAAGFTYLFLGFQYHDAGYSLARAVGTGALGGVAYVAYALPAAYLGSSTGLTHGLLTRSILGKAGSLLVSVLLIGVAAGWVAFAFNLLATLYDGLFGWGEIVTVSVVLAILGIVNNLFGFTGIAAFARFVVAPLLVVWILYLVVKGFVEIPGAVLGAGTVNSELPLLSGIGVAIGSVMWGNEPDTWRYGKPKVLWPLPVLAAAVTIGLVLFVAGGWMMAAVSGAGASDFGPAFRYTVGYSMFGLLWLGALVATVVQVAINDGNYYEMVNAGQNLLGQLPGWRRWWTCLLTAAVAAVFAWRFPQVETGFFTVTNWSSLALPSVTVVMCVDRFLVPRFGVRRPGGVPRWRDAGFANWPGIAAVLAAVGFGAWGLGLFPGQESTPSAGLPSVEAWLLAGVLYAALAGVAAKFPRAGGVLGFAVVPTDDDTASTENEESAR
ncbi:hypothetical protein [Amycolatopsis sp. CA-230715]|uniref:hypothetical protein n=1 Tax=Amycolatopsis sp. CA-230715 TaxID=2745196 RepID=UPI001C025D8E|nr:hypothetical protein [Amycolatopsis sp. CA-230715]QWF78624.1 hypothetical protein HUW46_02022 [Amycolatopsis sp. CA-230715]